MLTDVMLSLAAVLLIYASAGFGLLKSVDEQQEKLPSYWSVILHPTQFDRRRQPMQEGQQEHRDDGEEPEPDYYDAVQREDMQQARAEGLRQRDSSIASKDNENEEAHDAMHLMTVLGKNVDPMSELFPVDDNSGPKGGKSANPIVFPVTNNKTSTDELGTVDSDTYDDERAEVARMDVDEEEAEKNTSHASTVEDLPGKEMTIVVLDGPEAGVHNFMDGGDSDLGRMVDADIGTESGSIPPRDQPLVLPPKAKIMPCE